MDCEILELVIDDLNEDIYFLKNEIESLKIDNSNLRSFIKLLEQEIQDVYNENKP